jgi:hypothetical protein
VVSTPDSLDASPEEVPIALEVVRELASCDGPQKEYWTHVSAQEELPIAGDVIALQPPDGLDQLIERLPSGSSEATFEQVLASELLRDPKLLDQLRLLVSVSDKRCYLDLSYIFSRTFEPGGRERTLCGCSPDALNAHKLSFFQNILKRAERQPERATAAARTIARYLVETKGLSRILNVYGGLDAEQRKAIVEKLVLPSDSRQREAKRRGHGAEAALAALVVGLGCPILPADKVTHPMSASDPNVDPVTFEVSPREADTTISFDLLAMDENDRIRVCLQSLVQSSDPGQFGVEKAKDTGNARTQIDAFNHSSPPDRRIQLWGLLDGVGYSENKNGTLNRMLLQVHEFIQLKTIYKAALALHRLGLAEVRAIRFDGEFYSTSGIEYMSRYVPSGVEVLGAEESIDAQALPAGKATIYV